METPPASLPDDLLAVVLCRLPANSLATSRCVCKPWRDLIDDRELLLRFVLPHTVRGLFINYQDYGMSRFLSRPTSPPPSSSPEEHAAAGHGHHLIDGTFDFIERYQEKSWYDWYEVLDHCNGLVLFLETRSSVLHVCNPVTRWSARLPPWPPAVGATTDDVLCCTTTGVHDWGRRAFLVFDPFVTSSPETTTEYKVLLSPAEEPARKVERKRAKGRSKNKKQMEREEEARRRMMEWPPSPWTGWLEFSSATGRWEEKVFVREGEAVGTVGELMLNEDEPRCYRVDRPCRYAVYWKGALYLHCHGEFVSRLSLLDDKYRVIKLPVQFDECKKVRTFLGRSEKGVYMAAIARDASVKLRVWALRESGDQTEWVPKNGQGNLKLNTDSWHLGRDKFDDSKYWTLDHDPELETEHGTLCVDNRRKEKQDVSLKESVCSNSDDDGIVEVSDDEEDDVSLEENVYWNSDDDNIIVEVSDDEEDDVSLEINVCWNSDDDNIIEVSDDEEDHDGHITYIDFLGFHPYKEVIFLGCYGDAVAFHFNSPKVQYLGSVNLHTYNRGIRESFVYTPCF